MATCNPRVLFIHAYILWAWCEYVFFFFFFLYIYRVLKYCLRIAFAVRLFCIAIFCVLSLTGVTLPALLSQWSYVLWRNSSSCLTVKRLTIHHLFFKSFVCEQDVHNPTRPKIQSPKKIKKKRRWPSSFLLLQLNLGLLFLHSSITVLHSLQFTDMHATGLASLDIKWYIWAAYIR